MATHRPDDPFEWVKNRLADAHKEIAAIRISHHEPNATIKADMQGLKLQIEALTEIVQMLGAEVAALRHSAPRD